MALARARRPAPAAPAGLLSTLASTFTDLGLDVVKAEIGGSSSKVHDRFWVTNSDGTKLGEPEAEAVRKALEVTISSAVGTPGNVRPKLNVAGASQERAELLHTLMGERGTAEAERLPSRGRLGRRRRPSRGGLSMPPRRAAADKLSRPPACLRANRLPCSAASTADTYTNNDVLSIQQSIVHRECDRGPTGPAPASLPRRRDVEAQRNAEPGPAPASHRFQPQRAAAARPAALGATRPLPRGNGRARWPLPRGPRVSLPRQPPRIPACHTRTAPCLPACRRGVHPGPQPVQV
jgi:hypothetical protein